MPVDKEQVLKMLPTENVENQIPVGDQAALQRQELDNAFINILKSMRYEDAATAKPKRKSKINIPPGKSVGLEDFENSKFSDSEDDARIDDELEVDQVSDISGDDCEMEDDSNENTQKNMEPYPFPITAEQIKTDDWLIVKFLYSNKKASKKNTQPCICKVIELKKDKQGFTGIFMRPSISKVHPGLIYRGPDIADSSVILFTEVVGKLRPPEKYRGGLLKFDLNVGTF